MSLAAVLAQPFEEVFFPTLLAGYRNTLLLSSVAFGLSLAIGTVMAVVRIAPLPVLPRLARAEVELFRNTPLLLQMSFFQLGLGSIGVRLELFTIGALALSLYTGAYVTEVLRSGIAAVGKGQLEAARSLGMGFAATMRLVLLPQAFRTVIPPLGNLMIAMVKNSAIAGAVAYPDLLYESTILNDRYFRTFEILTAVAIGFLSITLPLSFVVSRLERRLRILR
ncbi:MAG: amino acid ABC transporter permease [Actinomycetota bacterium]